MSIQHRLKIQRYGYGNYKMPEPYMLTDSGLYPMRATRSHRAVGIEILNLMQEPPVRDKYYSGFSKIVRDYSWELDQVSNKRALTSLSYSKIIQKLSYFMVNPQMYGNEFNNFAIPWISGILFSMRYYTMHRMSLRGEVPRINFSTALSAGFYKFPKPMGNAATLELAAKIFDIVYKDALDDVLKNGMKVRWWR